MGTTVAVNRGALSSTTRGPVLRRRLPPLPLVPPAARCRRGGLALRGARRTSLSEQPGIPARGFPANAPYPRTGRCRTRSLRAGISPGRPRCGRAVRQGLRAARDIAGTCGDGCSPAGGMRWAAERGRTADRDGRHSTTGIAYRVQGRSTPPPSPSGRRCSQLLVSYPKDDRNRLRDAYALLKNGLHQRKRWSGTTTSSTRRCWEMPERLTTP